MPSWIRAGAPLAVVAAAGARGLARADLLAKARVGELPTDRRAPVPLTAHFAILESAMRFFADPGFPIDVAAQILPETYDVVGFAMRSAPDLETAARVALRYQQVYSNSSFMESERSAKGLVVRMRPSGPLPLAGRCATESAIAQALHVSRTLAGVAFPPLAVAFRHERPRSLRRHTEFFGIEPTFGAAFASITFAAEDAARPVVSSDPTLHAFLIGASEEALAAMPPSSSTLDQVRRLASELLPSGSLSIERVAARMGVSERTLRRQLSQEGSTFLEIRDEVRCSLAQQYLAEGGLSIAEIAFLLDFADERAFRRSFQRWTGATPTQHRRAAGGG